MKCKICGETVTSKDEVNECQNCKAKRIIKEQQKPLFVLDIEDDEIEMD